MAEKKEEEKCSLCGILPEESNFPFNRNVESTETNLCGICGAEYQCNWRPDFSPIEPNIELFLYQTRARIYIPKEEEITDRLNKKKTR